MMSTNKVKKQLENIEVGKCHKSIPCQHPVKKIYMDGSQKEKTYSGPEIYKKFNTKLNESDLQHFQISALLHSNRKVLKSIHQQNASESTRTFVKK